MTNQAHVFQHDITGVQIFVYHANDYVSAKKKFYNLVIDGHLWIYLGMKSAI